MYTRKLYATGSATANGVATLTIPNRSRLRGIQWSVAFDCITDNGLIGLEISYASATELTVNNAQQCISAIRWMNNFVTSGMSGSNVNLYVPVDAPFNQGQVLYLHTIVSGTVTYYLENTLWFQ